jgi:hypothetical protein
MTHDELLAKIDAWNEDHYQAPPLYHALRAVVELHKPIKINDHKNNSKESGFCLACTPPSLNFYEAIRHPCPTIQAIEKELK